MATSFFEGRHSASSRLAFVIFLLLALPACERPFVPERPPEIAEVRPDLSVVQTEATLALVLRAVSFREIASVMVNGTVLSKTGPETWQGTLALSFGLNTFVVEMKDTQGVAGGDTLYAMYLPVRFQEGPPLPLPRGGHTLTTLAGGHFLATGGVPALTDPAQPESFVLDPDLRAWQPAANLRHPRTAHAAALLPDGRVLITGGSRSESLEPSAFVETVEIFHPISNLFTEVAVKGTPIRRAHHTMSVFVLPNGPEAGTYIFIYGGRAPTGSITTPMGTRRDQRAFLLRGDTLHSLSSEPLYALAGHTQTLLFPSPPGAPAEYLISGSYFAASDEVENLAFRLRFSAENGFSLRNTSPPFAPRTRHAAAHLAPGIVVLHGGHGFTQGDQISTMEVYAAMANRFFKFSPALHTQRWGHAATNANGSRILFTGGFYANGMATTSTLLLSDNDQLP